MNEYGVFMEWICRWGNEVLGVKPVPLPLCSPEIPPKITWDPTRVSALTDRQPRLSVNIITVDDRWLSMEHRLNGSDGRKHVLSRCHFVHWESNLCCCREKPASVHIGCRKSCLLQLFESACLHTVSWRDQVHTPRDAITILPEAGHSFLSSFISKCRDITFRTS